MQQKNIHFAVVVNEYGDTSGIVTLEDLMEEIFGNIYDEFDEDEPEEIQQVGENLWRISGMASVEDIGEKLDIDLPESTDYTTLGGMVFSHLKRIPKDGTTVDVDACGLHIHVDSISRRKIHSALVSKSDSLIRKKNNRFSFNKSQVRNAPGFFVYKYFSAMALTSSECSFTHSS